MSCLTCNKTKQILSCTGILTVGTAGISTEYFVYIKNNTTGRILRYTVTSSDAGLVTITISDNQWMAGHNYELWLTLATATNSKEYVSFTVSGTSVNCVQLNFERVYDNDQALVSQAQTLTLE